MFFNFFKPRYRTLRRPARPRPPEFAKNRVFEAVEGVLAVLRAFGEVSGEFVGRGTAPAGRFGAFPFINLRTDY